MNTRRQCLRRSGEAWGAIACAADHSTPSSASCRSLLTSALTVAVVSLLALPPASAWGGSSSTGSEAGVYGSALDRDWLYNSKSISLKLEGCMWGYVGNSGKQGGGGKDGKDGNNNNRDSNGCMQESSEDGTEYWYQMANCRRAQAVFSLFASSSSSTSCSASNFKETFVTTNGLNEFVYYMTQYDPNNPFAENFNDDDGNNNGGNNNNNNGNDNFPLCEQKNGAYIGVGCADDGSFVLQYFSDQYCIQPTGNTYDKLRKLNKQLKLYRNCQGIGSSSSNNGGNNNNGGNLPQLLAYTAESCSSLDSKLCTDNPNMKTRRSSANSRMTRTRAGFSGNKTWLTKLKYVSGGLLLLASFVMFTGILFTNRRRRRALMQRKYKQSSRDGRDRETRSSSKTKSTSKSKSREPSKTRRSKSRTREDGAGGGGGVYT